MGIGGISLVMSNITQPYNLDAITATINKSLESEQFPAVWKTAIVKPILKSSNVGTVKDLLPILSPVLQNAVNSGLLKYFESNCIIPKCQLGLRKRRSLLLCCVSTTIYWYLYYWLVSYKIVLLFLFC